MRVLIIHNILWTHYKSILFEELQKQKSKNDDIRVLQIARNELSRKNMEGPLKKYDYDYHLLFDDYIENIPSYKKVFAVLKYIRSYNPDIVNITGFGGDLAMTFSILYAFLLSKKIVISNESTSQDQQGSFLKDSIKKMLFKMAKGFIVFGASSKEYLFKYGVKQEQIIEEKAAVVDDVSILEIFNETNNFLENEIVTSHNFIFVGRLIPEKNLDILISGFQRLKREVSQAKDWGLIVLGSGGEEKNLILLKNQQPDDIFMFKGVDWQTVPKYLTRANCLVLPSISEPWGLVVNEAMICGLSVIVSDKCGCKDDLVKGNGFIFKSGNETELFDAMSEIVKNENSNIELGSVSKEIIKDFKVENVAKRIFMGFENIHQRK
ncbi:glycosyltransferase [Lacihabitans sp. LS3-19]|uniref:glycosyltransferase family 4 protein n=1 Tax=Lacihabitans sp. LS3-19 TaxID=2487335 RepID=UPI0020CBDAC1|nr:glycosyltransferase family 4 protein [Lacihabitans sp. LS3-19]MCP9768142.1 glycosyltransferase [Lacihabitans sp. LS3-19]